MNNSTQMIRNRKILFIIVSCLFVASVIAAIIFAIIESRKTATLDLLVAPASAQISIGGQNYSSGTIKFEPGDYNVEITKDGFMSYTTSIKMTANETTRLYTYLYQTDGSLSWYDEHPDDMFTKATIDDALSDEASQADLDPINQVTPYTSPRNDFRIISERVQGEVKIIISFNTCSPQSIEIYKAEALNWLRGKNINLDSYTIEYSSLCD